MEFYSDRDAASECLAACDLLNAFSFWMSLSANSDIVTDPCSCICSGSVGGAYLQAADPASVAAGSFCICRHSVGCQCYRTCPLPDYRRPALSPYRPLYIAHPVLPKHLYVNSIAVVGDSRGGKAGDSKVALDYCRSYCVDTLAIVLYAPGAVLYRLRNLVRHRDSVPRCRLAEVLQQAEVEPHGSLAGSGRGHGRRECLLCQ